MTTTVTPRMNPEIKDRWTAWLRDPQHEQGTKYLRKGSKFCCLGGLCELAAEDEAIEARPADIYYDVRVPFPGDRRYHRRHDVSSTRHSVSREPGGNLPTSRNIPRARVICRQQETLYDRMGSYEPLSSASSAARRARKTAALIRDGAAAGRIDPMEAVKLLTGLIGSPENEETRS